MIKYIQCYQHDETQTYCLQTIKEIEDFLNKEIVERSRLHKKFKHSRILATCINHGLTTTTVITSVVGVATIATGVGVPLSLALGCVALSTTLATVITKRLESIYNVKSKKHSDICMTAENILDGKTISLSKAIQDGSINHDGFRQIVNEKQRYLTKKQEIRSKAKKVVHEITVMQRKEYLSKEDRKDVKKSQKSSSAIQIPNMSVSYKS